MNPEFADENLGVSSEVRKSLESVKRIKVNPPKSGHTYPALSDIESSGAGTPDGYTPEPQYTDDDNEQPIMDRYMYSSQDEGDEDRYFIDFWSKFPTFMIHFWKI